MQYDRSADGTLTPLPKPSVDTGAGLERIAAVMQGEDDNFHTDVFLPLIDRVGTLVGRPYDRAADERASYRVLADHARAVSFLLADGVYPGNEGRGYVLRRILRRAVRHAWLLGRREPTLAPLTEVVVAQMGDMYPELNSTADRSKSNEVLQGILLRERCECDRCSSRMPSISSTNSRVLRSNWRSFGESSAVDYTGDRPIHAARYRACVPERPNRRRRTNGTWPELPLRPGSKAPY